MTSVNRTVVCVSASPTIFIFLSLSVIWVIVCKFTELSRPRFRPVVSSAVLIVTASGGSISFCGSFLFSPDDPFFLWHSFNTASWFCFSLSATSLHLSTNTLFFILFYWQRLWVCCRCDYVDKAERSNWLDWVLHIGEHTCIDFISIAYTDLLLHSHSHCSYHPQQSHKLFLF